MNLPDPVSEKTVTHKNTSYALKSGNIIEIHLRADHFFSGPDVQDIVNVCSPVFDKNEKKVLVVLENFVLWDFETAEYFMTSEFLHSISAMAIVTSSVAQTLLLSVSLRKARRIIQIKLFRSITEANNWLNEV